MNAEKGLLDKNYPQYNDYNFKSILHQRANGLLKFIGIPYEILSVTLSEYMNLGPGISRIDFAGDVYKDGRVISLILECQTKLPNDEDIKRFFQYVASMRIFKNNDVELYILCTEKSDYAKKEFKINDECTYTMHVISLKQFKARKIFKTIEDKLKNKELITDEDIASLQVIVYTDYEEAPLEILIRARKLIERISVQSKMDLNDKKAVIYLLDVLCVNMLDENDADRYGEETDMLLNPTDRYLLKKGRKEGIKEGIIEGRKEGIDEGKLDVAYKLMDKGFSIEEVVELTGLAKEFILKGK